MLRINVDCRRSRAFWLMILLIAIGCSFAANAAAQSSAEKFFAKVEQEALRDLSHKNPQKQLEAMSRLDAKHAAALIPVFNALLAHPDANVRLAAAEQAWTQGQRDAKAFDSLNTALGLALHDSSAAVAMNAAGALRALGATESDLAPVRRQVLQSGQHDTYIGFLAARGLIGIDPSPGLFPYIFSYVVSASEAEARGGSDNNPEIAEDALKDLVQTKDRGLIPLLERELDLSPTIAPNLIEALNAFKPAPNAWVDTLLRMVDSPYEKIRDRAWDALSDQSDAAALAKWTPVAARALARDDRRDDALYALSDVAGRTTVGLMELRVLADDARASDDHRQRAIKTLGAAAEVRNQQVLKGVAASAKPLWLQVCAPMLQARPVDGFWKACRDGTFYVLAQEPERARLLGEWLQANGNVEAKIEFLQALEGMWDKAMPAAPTVRSARSHADARVVAAAEAALNRIEPAWRERDQRQAANSGTTSSMSSLGSNANAAEASKPSSSSSASSGKGATRVGTGGKGADGASLYGALAQGNLAVVKKHVNASNVNVPVRYPQMQGPLPPPIQVAINYCGIPQAEKGLKSIIEYLLALGANPDILEADGSNLLDRAKYTCSAEIMAVLAR